MIRKGIALIVMLLFVGMIISPSTGNIVENKPNFITEIDIEPCYLKSSISKEIILKKSYKPTIQKVDSIIINDSEYDDYHPAVAGDTKGRFFACFERTWDGVDYYPYFFYSLDGGWIWKESGYFTESLGAAYPDIDSNENGFYSTFGGPLDNPGQQWVIIAEDLEAITGRVWDWSSHGFDDFTFMSISCYTREGELWNYGGMAGTGYNGYQTYDAEGCPLIFYPVSNITNTGFLGWLPDHVDYLHSDFAIDEVTEMSYAVYDNEIEPHLLIRKDNFGVWSSERHPYVDSWYIDDGKNLSNPSVEAHDDIVVVVAEEGGDIVCFYSNNGWSSVSKSTVVSSATSPEIKVTFPGDLFTCSYIKDEFINIKTSIDGGVTWENETKIQDNQAVSYFGSHDLGKGTDGIYSVWEDTRGGDIDIYFGQAYESTNPELEITSIKGPIGVTASIYNIGDAGATDVEWTLKITCGLFNQMKKELNGTHDVLGVGELLKVKSHVLVGLCPLSAIATVICEEGSSDKKEEKGFQILIFSLI